jgi:hypothetical protein
MAAETFKMRNFLIFFTAILHFLMPHSHAEFHEIDYDEDKRGLDHVGSSLLEKREFEEKRGLDHIGNCLLDKRGLDHIGNSLLDKRGLDHIGSSLLDKRRLDHIGSSLLDKRGLDHIGSSLLDKRSTENNKSQVEFDIEDEDRDDFRRQQDQTVDPMMSFMMGKYRKLRYN